MAGLADFSADDIISSDDATVPQGITLAGAGTVPVTDPAGSASEATEPEVTGELPLDSAAIERAIANLAKPKAPAPEQVETPEAEEEVQEAKPKKMSPSQERIVALIAERNRANEAATQMAAQMAAIQESSQKQQAEYQRQQLEFERRRFEMMDAARREQEESRLSDVEKARRQFLRESKDEAKREMTPELQAMREEIQQLRAEKQAEKEAAEQNSRLAQFKNQANSVLNGVLLKGYTQEEQQALGSGMEEMLYSFSGAFGVDPVRAAPVFKQFLDRYVKAENSRVSRTAGAKVAESRQAPRPVPSARTAGGSASGAGPGPAGWPSMKQLYKGSVDGRTFDNHVQWIAAGKPALRP